MQGGKREKLGSQGQEGVEHSGEQPPLTLPSASLAPEELQSQEAKVKASENQEAEH